MESLPVEMSTTFCQYLSYEDLVNFMSTSKYNYSVCKQEWLNRHQKKHGVDQAITEGKHRFLSEEQRQALYNCIHNNFYSFTFDLIYDKIAKGEYTTSPELNEIFMSIYTPFEDEQNKLFELVESSNVSDIQYDALSYQISYKYLTMLRQIRFHSDISLIQLANLVDITNQDEYISSHYSRDYIDLLI